jgi:hypothetical protein
MWATVASICFCGLQPAMHAQDANDAKSAPEWRTSSYDNLRDGWQRNEPKLTLDNVSGMKLLWTLKTDNVTMGMQSFREPLIISGVKMSAGEKTIAILAGSKNDVYGIDTDSGALLWKTHLKWSASKPETPGVDGGFICTKALTATPVVTPKGGGPRMLYVLGTDGYAHTLDIATGTERKAQEMMPGIYGKAYGLNMSGNILYTVSGQGCGGVPNELYALDVKTGKAFNSPARQAGIFGTAGPSIGSDGTIYLETGDGGYNPATGALSTTVQGYTEANDTLTLKDYYTPINHEWLTIRDLDMNVTPVVFPYKGRELLVGSGKEGRYFLMDSANMGGADHMTPLYRSPLFSNTNVNYEREGTWGSLGSWLDSDGTRWVLAPIGGTDSVKFPVSYGDTPDGATVAMKVVDKDGKTWLEPAWVSRNMMTAEPPVVANGVVYVLAAGEFTGQADDVNGGLFSWQQRVAKSIPAILYALDAKSGKVLYSSGDQIKSFLHQSGIALANGKVIFGTFDGTIYCFGLPQ